MSKLFCPSLKRRLLYKVEKNPFQKLFDAQKSKHEVTKRYLSRKMSPSSIKCIHSLNSFGTKFQTAFVVCFSFLTNYRLTRSSYVKLKDWRSNSIDPDETAHMSRLIWTYAVCKNLLLSPVAVKYWDKIQSNIILVLTLKIPIMIMF